MARIRLTNCVSTCFQAYLQPNEASTVITDRLKVINKLNTDIADWLQVRKPPMDCCARISLRNRELPGASETRGIIRPGPPEACAATTTRSEFWIGVGMPICHRARLGITRATDTGCIQYFRIAMAPPGICHRGFGPVSRNLGSGDRG
jgi:hypothetical protein